MDLVKKAARREGIRVSGAETTSFLLLLKKFVENMFLGRVSLRVKVALGRRVKDPPLPSLLFEPF